MTDLSLGQRNPVNERLDLQGEPTGVSGFGELSFQ